MRKANENKTMGGENVGIGF